jgi:glyoxylase-like metal-dependent hydrolase (beta-lactamase superfamily II)
VLPVIGPAIDRWVATRSTLVDFGFTPQALNNNLKLLEMRPRTLEVLVLSHGHYDHFGGLTGFLADNKAKLRPKLALYVGGEDRFCAREWHGEPAMKMTIPKAVALRNLHAQIELCPTGHGRSKRFVVDRHVPSGSARRTPPSVGKPPGTFNHGASFPLGEREFAKGESG